MFASVGGYLLARPIGVGNAGLFQPLNRRTAHGQLGLLRAPADVRRAEEFRVRHQTRMRVRFNRKHIRGRAGEVAAFERGYQRVFVHQPATGRIDQTRALRHRRQFRCADHPAGRGVQRHVQRDDLGFTQQVIQRDRRDAMRS